MIFRCLLELPSLTLVDHTTFDRPADTARAPVQRL
jgi:hypothetical protein